mmetsp:Transcript_9316/g.27825  ORF Transcript_9316/g.27825 Transcript_9316/m.27825 type:complete len:218 (+) Transcript_9316:198-851(+)
MEDIILQVILIVQKSFTELPSHSSLLHWFLLHIVLFFVFDFNSRALSRRFLLLLLWLFVCLLVAFAVAIFACFIVVVVVFVVIFVIIFVTFIAIAFSSSPLSVTKILEIFHVFFHALFLVGFQVLDILNDAFFLGLVFGFHLFLVALDLSEGFVERCLFEVVNISIRSISKTIHQFLFDLIGNLGSHQCLLFSPLFPLFDFASRRRYDLRLVTRQFL